MTSPVGVIGLTYDGYDLQRADLNVLFQITEGLDELPAVRQSDEIVPFRSGRLASLGIGDHRPIVATGWVAGAAPAPQASYRAYLDGLKKVLDPARLPATLVATLTDGTMRWIPAVPRSLIGGETIGYEMRPLSIEWDALDPYWYSPYGTLTFDSGWSFDTGYYFDGSGEIVLTAASPIASVSVPGTADVERIRVQFTGPSVGPVGIDVDGVGLVMSAPLAAGAGGVATHTVTVDNYARTVVDEGGRSVRAQMTLRAGNANGEYLRIKPGLRQFTVFGQPTKTRIQFTPAWL